MINRLPLTVGFARVSQATEDQGNLETQTRQLQDYGVHELVTEIGSGAGSDRLALRDLQARHDRSVLFQVPDQTGDRSPAGCHPEERPARDDGEMPGVREEVVPHGLLVRSQGYPGEAGYIGGWRDRHVRGSGGLAPGNRQPVCTQGGTAAWVSKWGTMTPKMGPWAGKTGEHFSYTGLRVI